MGACDRRGIGQRARSCLTKPTRLPTQGKSTDMVLELVGLLGTLLGHGGGMQQSARPCLTKPTRFHQVVSPARANEWTWCLKWWASLLLSRSRARALSLALALALSLSLALSLTLALTRSNQWTWCLKWWASSAAARSFCLCFTHVCASGLS